MAGMTGMAGAGMASHQLTGVARGREMVKVVKCSLAFLFEENQRILTDSERGEQGLRHAIDDAGIALVCCCVVIWM